MIKLALFDVDRTLKQTGCPCPPGTVAAISSLQARGVKCTVATGRAWPRILKNIGFIPDAPLILEDGARISDEHGKPLFLKQIEPEIIEKFKEWLKTYSACFCHCTFTDLNGGGYWFFVSTAAECSNVSQIYKDIIKGITQNTAQFIRWLDSLATACIWVKFNDNFIDQGVLPANLPHSLNGENCLINPYGINKGTAVSRLSEIIGISLSEMAVFGNDHNDVPMFLPEVGLRVAVLPSPQKLLDKATHIVTGVEDLGAFLVNYFGL